VTRNEMQNNAKQLRAYAKTKVKGRNRRYRAVYGQCNQFTFKTIEVNEG